jgi:hypothetical protein
MIKSSTNNDRMLYLRNNDMFTYFPSLNDDFFKEHCREISGIGFCFLLKEHYHEIYDPRFFFHQSN